MTNEAYLLGLEATPMLIACLMLAVVHPGFLLQGKNSEFPRLTRTEKKANKRAKKYAKTRSKSVSRGDNDFMSSQSSGGQAIELREQKAGCQQLREPP